MNAPLCFIHQYNNAIQIHVNSFKYGHNVLKWYEDGKPDHTEVLLISSQDVTVKNITREGAYWFYTEDPTGQQSLKMRVYILKESCNAMVDRILSYMPDVPNEKFARDIILRLRNSFNHDPSEPIARHLVRLMNETKDISLKEKKFFHECIAIAIRYFNSLNITMNKTISQGVSISYEPLVKISFPSPLTKIKAFVDENGISCPYKLPSPLIDISLTRELELVEQKAYHFILAEEGNWKNYFIHYQFDEEYLSNLWEDKHSEDLQLEKIIQDDAEIATSSIAFSEDEKKMLLKERAKESPNYIVSRPEIVNANSQESVIVKVKDIKLLQALECDVYIATKEDDLLFSDNFDLLEPITEESVALDRNKNYIDGNMLFYVEDGRGNILSPLCRFDFYNDLTEYAKKAKDVRLNKYCKRVIDIIRYRAPEAEIFVADVLAKLRSDNAIDADKPYLALIAEINRSYHADNIDTVMFSILEEWNNNFNYDSEFFASPISYERSTDIIAFPPREVPYVLCVGTLDIDSADVMMQYMHSMDTAIEIELKQHLYYFMYAIDTKTYRPSGFLMANTLDQLEVHILKNNISFETR